MANNGESPQDTVDGFEVLHALSRDWFLRHCGPGIRLAYSQWCKSRARAYLRSQRPYLTESEYREERELMQDRMMAGAFDWGLPTDPLAMGGAVSAIMVETEGWLHLIQDLLRERHGEVSPKDIQEIGEAEPEALRKTVRKCLGLPPLQPDPNSTAPTPSQTAPGLAEAPASAG